MRDRAVVVGTVVLAVVLGALIGLTFWLVAGTASKERTVAASVAGLSAYQDVQRALAAEAFAEAGYRRHPTPASRQRVEAAISSLDTSVDSVRALGSARDDGGINYLLVLNGRYEREVLAMLRTGTLPPPVLADDRVAGPALDAMQWLLDAAVERRQHQAEVALMDQRALQGRLVRLGPAVLGVAVLALSLCWTVIVRQHRRSSGRAADSERRALHDTLTKVGNRALLQHELERELRLGHPDAALIMVDLDRFKQVNDEHGHDAGDEVLRVVAARLVRAAGSPSVVCRMGGDEFAVLVRPARACAGVASRIRDELLEPVLHGELLLPVGGSVGLARLRAGMTERDLLVAADDSLYAAKRLGRELALPAQRLPSDPPASVPS